MGKLLTGKQILVMGVANQRSIAWGCAQVMAEQGAELIYTYQNERMKKSVAKLVTDDTRLVECDVASDESIQTAFATIKARFGQLDGLVHAIAYAKKEELGGSIINVTRAGYALAQDVSAYSLLAVMKEAERQALLKNPASVVTLTYFGSERAIPNYNVMGVAKAALEANVRYLARDLGTTGIRVNAISAGAGVGAWILHLGTWGTLLSAAIPAVALYPAMKGYQKSEREKAEREGITKYLEQLSLVREEIDGVLNCSAC